MILVTRFQADDGSMWTTVERAIARDELREKVERIMEPLEKLPLEANFPSGGGFIQQDAATVLKARVELLDLAAEHCPAFAGKFQDAKHPDVHPSWAMRLLGSEPAPLVDALNRLCRMDGLHREWEQAYYAAYPDEANHVRLNP